MMYLGFMRSRRVVTMVGMREVDIKEEPELDMEEAKGEDMEEVEEYPHLF
jgi:hypothetical protein